MYHIKREYLLPQDLVIPCGCPVTETITNQLSSQPILKLLWFKHCGPLARS